VLSKINTETGPTTTLIRLMRLEPDIPLRCEADARGDALAFPVTKPFSEEPSMNPAEKSIASLRREAAVVGLCAVACFLAGTAIGLAAQLKIVNPGLSNALFQVFLVCGLMALGHSQLAVCSDRRRAEARMNDRPRRRLISLVTFIVLGTFAVNKFRNYSQDGVKRPVAGPAD
jgi:hypothetical protein